SAIHAPLDREARRAGDAGPAILDASGRRRPGPLRRQRHYADRRGADGATGVSFGDRSTVLRRHSQALGKVHRQEGAACRERVGGRGVAWCSLEVLAGVCTAMARKRKQETEQALLSALAFGATVEHAARKAGLTERTVYRRLAEPAFRARLDEMRRETLVRT